MEIMDRRGLPRDIDGNVREEVEYTLVKLGPGEKYHVGWFVEGSVPLRKYPYYLTKSKQSGTVTNHIEFYFWAPTRDVVTENEFGPVSP